LRDEQIGLNYHATLDNQHAIGRLEESMKTLFKYTRDLNDRIIEVEELIQHHGDGLHALEEKESARARADHARGEHLDFVNSEGLGET